MEILRTLRSRAQTGEDSLELKVLRMSRDSGAGAHPGVFPKQQLSPVTQDIAKKLPVAPIVKVGTGLNHR